MDPTELAAVLKEIRINSYWQLLILSTFLPGVVLLGELLFLMFGGTTSIRDLSSTLHDLYWPVSLLLFVIFIAASVLVGLASRHVALLLSRHTFNKEPERNESWTKAALSSLDEYFAPQESRLILSKYPFWEHDRLLNYVPFCRYWTEVHQPMFYRRIKRDELEINFQFALVPPLILFMAVCLKLHCVGLLTWVWCGLLIAALIVTVVVISLHTIRQRSREEFRTLRIFVTAHLVTDTHDTSSSQVLRLADRLGRRLLSVFFNRRSG